MKHQLIVIHHQASLGHEVPAYDLGWLEFNQLPHLCGALTAAAGAAGYGVYAGPVQNILEAWSSADYKVYFLPEEPSHPAWEYTGDGPQQCDDDDDPRGGNVFVH